MAKVDIVEAGKKTRWKPGQSGHPAGKPKGTKHISTYIQEMLTDEKFEAVLLDSKKGAIEYKGAPIKAIIAVAVQKALNDKEKGQAWAEWLAKHGYGSNVNLNIRVDDSIEKILVESGLRKEVEEGSGGRKNNEPVSGSPEDKA